VKYYILYQDKTETVECSNLGNLLKSLVVKFLGKTGPVYCIICDDMDTFNRIKKTSWIDRLKHRTFPVFMAYTALMFGAKSLPTTLHLKPCQYVILAEIYRDARCIFVHGIENGIECVRGSSGWEIIIEEAHEKYIHELYDRVKKQDQYIVVEKIPFRSR